jgi:hypothetical protein
VNKGVVVYCHLVFKTSVLELQIIHIGYDLDGESFMAPSKCPFPCVSLIHYSTFTKTVRVMWGKSLHVYIINYYVREFCP